MSAASYTRLILVRHGVADGIEGRCVGQVDLALSAAGDAAARRLARSWEGAPPARLVASDLARTAATATPLAERWGMAMERDARLREMSFGEWDGRSWRELGDADGERVEGWMANWAAERVPGGEGFPDVIARVAAWAAEVRAAAAPGETVLAVAHAGSIRALLCHLLGWTPAQAFRVRVDNTHATALALHPASEPRGAELLYCNSDAFPRAAEPAP